MPWSPPERIELPDFVLRRSRAADASMIAASVAANLDHLHDWMPWATPEAGTLASQEARSTTVEASWDSAAEFEFLAVDRRTGAHLGTFSLMRRVGPLAVELGYWLTAAATGHGYATAAAGALTRAGLALPDVERVEIHCDAGNVRSRLVAERLGYRLDRVEDRVLDAPASTSRTMVWVTP